MNQRTSAITTGAYLALATAMISGVSVYVNSYGVRQVPDPFVFTTAKNLVVALLLASLIILPFRLHEIRQLTKGAWAKLLTLGLIGGSIPFLLFFSGLREATAPSAAFMHKTLFIWVAVLAVPFLKEKVGPMQVAALAVLVLGNLVLSGLPARWDLSRAELFTLSATVLWAVEAVLARRFLAGELSPSVGALGRMGFGALIMLLFLSATGRGDTLVSMTPSQWGWVLTTAAFLLGYVLGYYGALKRAPATLVSSVLVLGSVVTSFLYAVFDARAYTASQVLGFILTVAATAAWLYLGHRVAKTLRFAPETKYV